MTRGFMYDRSGRYAEYMRRYFTELFSLINFPNIMLPFSYEFGLPPGYDIKSVQFTLKGNKVDYRLLYKNGYNYPAGEETIAVPDDIINGILVRLRNPNKYKF